MGRPFHPLARLVRSFGAFGRAALLLAGIWVLGLVALGAVVSFQSRLDDARSAQVVIAQMRNQQGAILAAAFNPALDRYGVVTRAVQDRQIAAAKRTYTASIEHLAHLGGDATPARITRASAGYLALIDHISSLIAANKSNEAALLLGRSQRQGGVAWKLQREFDRADLDYGRLAGRSSQVGTAGSVAVILFLLLAFSVALDFTVRARRRSQHDAMTDALTGLGNRRKLFSDMDLGVHARSETLAVGMFDLDGFKAFNDRFGHPAGDDLLARLGSRLEAVVGAQGSAYRIGGDEFVVITPASDGEGLLAAAQEALSERGAGYAIGCSRGAARILTGITLEHAMHVADQRLYANKRPDGKRMRMDAKDALLQVLTEQNGDLALHLGHVAELAAATAQRMGLAPEEVELTRLAAELHDVGKAAIPAWILDKPDALSADERSYMQRHSAIGERIVASAPTLEALGPIIRASHERADGTGYPDGMRLEEIPLAARIIAVVDAFDAMTNDRPYRKAVSHAEALVELRRHAGTQFDAAIVESFASVIASGLEVSRAA